MTIFKIDVYSGATTKKDNSIDINEDLKSIDPLILSLIQQIFICNNVYINKCKSSRGKFINSFLINGDKKKLFKLIEKKHKCSNLEKTANQKFKHPAAAFKKPQPPPNQAS
jgi:hypothetical protein